MDQPITGGCFCGAVRFAVATRPVAARACWCRDCQYLACGNASINLVFPSSSLTASGTTTEFVSRADSGNEMRRRFCAACGTQLFSAATNRPDFVVVRVGALDDPAIGAPASVIWAASAPDWACFDPALPRFERHVPAISEPPATTQPEHGR